MKWAILSDVHGNLEAFQAAIQDLRQKGVERIAFLGDIVGYGANPNECADLLQDLSPFSVAGNHDFAVVRKTDVSYFNSVAKAAVLWTQKILTDKNRAFLDHLPLTRQWEEMVFVHATPNDPDQWNYIFSFPEAEAGFQALIGELAFIGHSHRPLILSQEKNKKVKALDGEEITLEKGVRYIINVGSVGQPRDGNPNAAYGILDTDAKKYRLRRVPYDIETAQRKIIQAGLPVLLAERLASGS
jgi:diadenosine tetraphosphatase ApaH/serine/threonine PP2A family protein phosphatase